MKIVVLSTDLMDRSRISSALGDVTFVRDAADVTGADVVVVDLARHADAVASVRATLPDARIVGFGPHVDAGLFARATSDGADVAIARSRFFQDPQAVLGHR
jgi:hypothetical protein